MSVTGSLYPVILRRSLFIRYSKKECHIEPPTRLAREEPFDRTILVLIDAAEWTMKKDQKESEGGEG